MPIIKEMFVPKELIKDKIDLLVENLTAIQDDSGEFLLDFDGMKVDDKSWSVWNLLSRSGTIWYLQKFPNNQKSSCI